MKIIHPAGKKWKTKNRYKRVRLRESEEGRKESRRLKFEFYKEYDLTFKSSLPSRSLYKNNFSHFEEILTYIVAQFWVQLEKKRRERWVLIGFIFEQDLGPIQTRPIT